MPIKESLISEKFTEDLDDEDILKIFFQQLDTDHDQRISEDEIKRALSEHRHNCHDVLLDALEAIEHLLNSRKDHMKSEIRDLCNSMTIRKIKEELDKFEISFDGLLERSDLVHLLVKAMSERSTQSVSVTFDDFREIMAKIPRTKGHRVGWVRTFGLERVLAYYLKAGDFYDGFNGIRNMSEHELESACSAFAKDVHQIIKREWESLRQSATSYSDRKMNPRAMMSKFIDDGGFFSKFGERGIFEGGLQSQIGMPDSFLLKGILRENVSRGDSQDFFLTSNYKTCTSPALEYARVLGNHAEYEASLEQGTVRILSKVPEFMKNRAVQDWNGPSDAELNDLSSDFEILQRLYQRFSMNEVFPGDVGYVEYVYTLAVTGSNGALRNLNFVSTAKLATRIVEAVKNDDAWEGLTSLRIFTQQNDDTLTLSLFLPGGSAEGMSESRESVLFDAVEKTLRPFECTFTRKATEKSKSKYLRYIDETTLREDLQAEDLSQLRKRAGNMTGTREECIDAVALAFSLRAKAWEDQGYLRKQGRRRLTLQKMMEIDEVRQANLRFEEALQAYQYTGPMFQVWNNLLRCMPLSAQCRNRYATSIHVLVSAVVKLSSNGRIPTGRKVYRGLGGAVLDVKWFDADPRGCRGGVQLPFLSTSLSRDVAVAYSGVDKRRGIVLEIEIGAVDCGARMDAISQYPSENEMLFCPLSFLEVVAEPRVEAHGSERIVVVPVRINVNLKANSIEEMLGKRKAMILSVIDNLEEEVSFDMPLLQLDLGPALPGLVSGRFAQLRSDAQARDSAWFSNDANFQKYLGQILNVKTVLSHEILRDWLKIDGRSLWGCKGLIYASQRGKSELVQTLLFLGADPNLHDAQNNTALDCAARGGHVDAMRALIAAKANVIGTGNDRSPLFWACSGGFTEAVQVLIESKAVCTGDTGAQMMALAASRGNVDVVKLLLNAKAEARCADAIGRTPLQWAAIGGHGKVVELLIDKGASVTETSVEEFTPLHWAARRGQVEAVRTLIRAQASVRAQDSEGCTPLHLACKSSSVQVVKLLLQANADVEARNVYGETPLLWLPNTLPPEVTERLERLLRDQGAMRPAAERRQGFWCTHEGLCNFIPEGGRAGWAVYSRPRGRVSGGQELVVWEGKTEEKPREGHGDSRAAGRENMRARRT